MSADYASRDRGSRNSGKKDLPAGGSCDVVVDIGIYDRVAILDDASGNAQERCFHVHDDRKAAYADERGMQLRLIELGKLNHDTQIKLSHGHLHDPCTLPPGPNAGAGRTARIGRGRQ